MASTPTAYLTSVSKGLTSRQPKQQLAACKQLLQTHHPDGVAGTCDVLAAHMAVQGTGSLGKRLLQLAMPTAADLAAHATTDEHLAVAAAAWCVIDAATAASALARAHSLTARQLYTSPLLQPAVAAALADLNCHSTRSTHAAAMSVAVSIAVQHEPQPPWLASFLAAATEALEVSPLMGSDGILSHALTLLWLYRNDAALVPLLARAVAAILDRHLYLQRGVCSSEAAMVLSLAWEHGTGVLRERLRGVDLSAVACEAPAAPHGSNLELNHLQLATAMADHPSFQEHALHWLLPRLLRVMRSPVEPTVQFVGALPELLTRRPDLLQPFLDRGLLPALACYIARTSSSCSSGSSSNGSSSSGIYDGNYAATVAVRAIARLAAQQPAVFSTQACSSSALNTALQYAFGRSCQQLLQMLARYNDDVDKATCLQIAASCADQLRGESPAAAAAGRAQLALLQRLHMCAYAGCSRVEEKRGTMKACAACKARVAAAQGSGAGGARRPGSVAGRNGSSSDSRSSDRRGSDGRGSGGKSAGSSRRRRTETVHNRAHSSSSSSSSISSSSGRSGLAQHCGGSSANSSNSSHAIAAPDCYYCNEACQQADWHTGHAGCLLQSLGQVTPETLTPRETKKLLKLLGDPGNTALMQTLETIQDLFAACFTAIQSRAAQDPPTARYAQVIEGWVAAGLGSRLVQCMAGLQSRRVWRSAGDGPEHGSHCFTAVHLAVATTIINLALFVLLPGVPGGHSSEAGQAHAVLLQQQLCNGGGGWLAFALAELGHESTPECVRRQLMRSVAEVGMTMVRLCAVRGPEEQATAEHHEAAADQHEAAAEQAARQQRPALQQQAAKQEEAAAKLDAADGDGMALVKQYGAPGAMEQAVGEAGTAAGEAVMATGPADVATRQSVAAAEQDQAKQLQAVLAAAATPAVLTVVAECTATFEQQRAAAGRASDVTEDCFALLGLMTHSPAQMQHLATCPAFVAAAATALTNAQRAPHQLRNVFHVLHLLGRLAREDQGSADVFGAAAGQLLPPMYQLLPMKNRHIAADDHMMQRAVRTLKSLTRSPAAIAAMAASGKLQQLDTQRIASWPANEVVNVLCVLGMVHPELVAPGAEPMEQLASPGRELWGQLVELAAAAAHDASEQCAWLRDIAGGVGGEGGNSGYINGGNRSSCGGDDGDGSCGSASKGSHNFTCSSTTSGGGGSSSSSSSSSSSTISCAGASCLDPAPLKAKPHVGVLGVFWYDKDSMHVLKIGTDQPDDKVILLIV